MDAQSKLNKLFDELEHTAVTLTTQRERLQQDITKLEARQKYLEGQMANLEGSMATQKSMHDANTAAYAKEAAKLAADCKRKETELANLCNKLVHIQDDIDMAKYSGSEQEIKLSKSVKSIQNDIAKLLEQKRTAEAELHTIQAEVTASKEVARVLDSQVSTQAKEVAADLEVINAQITSFEQERDAAEEAASIARQKLETITQDITNRQSQIATFVASKADFEEYKRRANDALKAQELSLLERERKLQAAELRASRRGILDNV